MADRTMAEIFSMVFSELANRHRESVCSLKSSPEFYAAYMELLKGYRLQAVRIWNNLFEVNFDFQPYQMVAYDVDAFIELGFARRIEPGQPEYDMMGRDGIHSYVESAPATIRGWTHFGLPKEIEEICKLAALASADKALR